MQTPQLIQVNVEDLWYGPESIGRYATEPAIYLYYGDEGIDKNYTARSVTDQIDGWTWTSKISSQGAGVVFSSIEGTDADPLDDIYSEEIEAILQLQKHNHVRAVTSGRLIPSESVDDLVDHYTVVFPNGEFRKPVEEKTDNTFDWFANESEMRDRVDFVFGHSGKSRVRDDIGNLRKEYLVPNERIWLYPEEGVGYEKVASVAKQSGVRVSLPPNYFKRCIEGTDEKKDEGTDD